MRYTTIIKSILQILLKFCEVKYVLRLKANHSNVSEKDIGLMKQKFLTELMEQGWIAVAFLKLHCNVSLTHTRLSSTRSI